MVTSWDIEGVSDPISFDRARAIGSNALWWVVLNEPLELLIVAEILVGVDRRPYVTGRFPVLLRTLKAFELWGS